MQRLLYIENDQVCSIVLPPPNEEVLPGVPWGEGEKAFTPAYWTYQVVRRGKHISSQRLGDTLIEEIVACLLGGYGIPAEIGLAAFQSLKSRGYLSGAIHHFDEIYGILSKPINLNGKEVNYRFAKQKSEYIAQAIKWYDTIKENIKNALDIRSCLLSVKGIGPKTASWIIRNWFGSDDVAILDIHIYKAGLIAGFFALDDNVATEYFKLERKFLAFSNAIGVKASILDAVMWSDMRISPKTVDSLLHSKSFSSYNTSTYC